MSEVTVGFIGSGRVTAFMLEGFAHAGSRVRAILADIDPALSAKRASLAPFAVDAGTDFARAANCDIVFLALHFPAFADASAAISGHLKPGAIVVSLAPKGDMRTISGMLKTDRIARFLPNAPSSIGTGYNPVAYADALGDADRAALSALFSAFGETRAIAERDFAAFAVLCAMGPTYLWPILDEMRQLGIGFGLTAGDARDLVAYMAEGAASLMLSGKSHAELMDMVPLKPMAANEGTIRDLFRKDLGAMHAKLTT